MDHWCRCGPAAGFRRGFPGQSIGVSLPVSQQRVLAGIENALEGGEPRLGSMFAIFTRLTRDEEVPRTEALPEETFPWLSGRLTATWRAVIAVPVILGLVTLFVLTAISSSAPQGCRPGPVISRTVSCQSAQGPEGHS
jgi:hypothetical protein